MYENDLVKRKKYSKGENEARNGKEMDEYKVCSTKSIQKREQKKKASLGNVSDASSVQPTATYLVASPKETQHQRFLSLSLSHFQSAIMAPPTDFDLAGLGTPENCVADFCLIPV